MRFVIYIHTPCDVSWVSVLPVLLIISMYPSSVVFINSHYCVINLLCYLPPGYIMYCSSFLSLPVLRQWFSRCCFPRPFDKTFSLLFIEQQIMGFILYLPLRMLTDSPISYVSCINLSVNTIVLFSCYCNLQLASIVCPYHCLYVTIPRFSWLFYVRDLPFPGPDLPWAWPSPNLPFTAPALHRACPSPGLPFTGTALRWTYPSSGRLSRPTLPRACP